MMPFSVATNGGARVASYVTATVASGAGSSLTSTVNSGFTNVYLTPGEWDVSGCVGFTGTYGSASALRGAITVGSAGNGTPGETASIFPSLNSGSCFALPIVRVSITESTTVYLNGQLTFGSGNAAPFGTIRARGIR